MYIWVDSHPKSYFRLNAIKIYKLKTWLVKFNAFISFLLSLNFRFTTQYSITRHFHQGSNVLYELGNLIHDIYALLNVHNGSILTAKWFKKKPIDYYNSIYSTKILNFVLLRVCLQENVAFNSHESSIFVRLDDYIVHDDAQYR